MANHDISNLSLRLEEPARTTVWATWNTIAQKFVHVTYKHKKKTKEAYNFKEYRLYWSYKVPGVKNPYTPPYTSVTSWNVGTATYSVPSNASSVTLKVKVIYEKKGKKPPTVSDKNVKTIYISAASDYVPAKPTLSHTLVGNNLTISSQITPAELQKGTDRLVISLFQFYSNFDGSEVQTNYRNDSYLWYNGSTQKAAWTVAIEPGFYYRYTAINNNSHLGYNSEQSDWSANVYAAAAKPTSFSVTTENSKAVRLWFDVLGYVEGYEVQWATRKDYLDTTELITTSGMSEAQTWDEEDRTSMSHRVRHVVNNLEPGNVYWFRIRAKSGSFGNSPWSDIYKQILGKSPGPPSTYSSKTSARLGEEVNLYWVHNTQDGSNQVNAQIALYANLNVTDDDLLTAQYIDVPNPWLDDLDETNDNKTVFYPLSLTTIGNYTVMDGDTIRWKVRTKGVYTEELKDAVENFDIVTPSIQSATSTVSVELQNSPIINTAYTYVTIFINRTRGMHLAQDSDAYSISGNVLTIDFDHIKSHIKPSTQLGLRIAYKYGNEGYGDWSELRSISVYSNPEAQIALRTGWSIDPENPSDIDPIYDVEPVNEITSYPIAVTMGSTPASQKVISYNLKIINAGEEYETYNAYGEPITVGSHEIIYQKYFDVDTDSKDSNTKTLILYPTDVSLMSGEQYTFELEAYMESGLSAIAPLKTVSVSLGDSVNFFPLAVITPDPDNYMAYILPYCYDDIEDDGSGDIEEGITIDDVNTEYLSDNVVLDVYRIETDGSFTLLRPNIPNNGWTSITDPHPALDYARYRIVARKINTAKANYIDYLDEEMGVHSLVIQWNETWVNYRLNDITLAAQSFADQDLLLDDAMIVPSQQQGLLVLPWNIDTSEDFKQDVSLVEYIGREHPVSYYGTQKGQTASWSTDIDKQDKDTLFKLRRLSNFMGDCYVREPSGTGYWANVQVNWSQTHNEPAIPVSISVTRVEGPPEYDPDNEE